MVIADGAAAPSEMVRTPLTFGRKLPGVGVAIAPDVTTVTAVELVQVVSDAGVATIGVGVDSETPHTFPIA
jgi:hypothetical protein